MRIVRHLLPLAAFFIVALQSPERPTPPSGQFQNFTLTLTTPKTKYLELQPIPLVVTFKNETQSPLTGHNVLDFGAPYLRLYMDRDDGPREIQVSMLIKDIYAKPREFQPAQEVKTTDSLSLDLNKVFPKPGAYKLYVRFRSLGGDETITSKPIEVEIAEPDGLDAEALNYIRDNAKPAYFFTGYGAVKNPEQLQVLENFVAIYGQSSYGDDATLLLGEIHFALRDYEKARKHLEKLSKKPDFAFAARVSERLRMIDKREADQRNRP